MTAGRRKTPADPDAELRQWLRTYCHRPPVPWVPASLGGAAPSTSAASVNKKKVHRLVAAKRACSGRVHSPTQAWVRHCAVADAWGREQRAIAARSDQQHAWALAGDPRGTYGADFIAGNQTEAQAV